MHAGRVGDQILPEPLAAWLEAATEGLCDEARERIQDEILGHYLDALEAARAEGRSEIDAHAVVMEALGDPRESARAFRRTDLTRFQARLADDYLGGRSRWRPAVYIPFIGLLAVLAADRAESRLAWNGSLALIGAMVVALIVIQALVPWLTRRGRARAGLTLGVWSDWLLIGSVNVWIPYLINGTRALIVGSLVFAVSFGVVLALYLPFLHKIKNNPSAQA